MRSTDYVLELFEKEDYHTLENVLHPLDRFESTTQNNRWCTLLMVTMSLENTRVFRHFITTYGITIMNYDVSEYEESAWQALLRFLYEGGPGYRPLMALYEILLDEDAAVAESKIAEMEITSYYLSTPWCDSKHNKKKALPAAVWCCKAIRSEGADGLEEVLGKRLQAASTWDWEPKMKRCKY
jgi:hypothetical protein